jgi:hypothetical protein
LLRQPFAHVGLDELDVFLSQVHVYLYAVMGLP